MENSFHVGRKVVCVDGDAWERNYNGPALHEVSTIQGFQYAPNGTPALELAEYPIICKNGKQAAYLSIYFRPIDCFPPALEEAAETIEHQIPELA